MNPLILGALLDVGKSLIDRIFPDKEKMAQERAAAELELLKLTQSERMQDKANEVQLALAQIDVNKTEAANPNPLVSGWRPAVGWTCAASFAYAFFIGPLMTSVGAAFGVAIPLPALDMANMMYVLGGLLGLGGLRTFEKVKGVA